MTCFHNILFLISYDTKIYKMLPTGKSHVIHQICYFSRIHNASLEIVVYLQNFIQNSSVYRCHIFHLRLLSSLRAWVSWWARLAALVIPEGVPQVTLTRCVWETFTLIRKKIFIIFNLVSPSIRMFSFSMTAQAQTKLYWFVTLIMVVSH